MVKVLDKKTVKKDDSLFGLLAPYKIYVTYFRVLFSEKNKKVFLQLTDNPKNWDNYSKDYRILRRIELGSKKLFLKYLSPRHLLIVMGPLLGIKIPEQEVVINDQISEEIELYSLLMPDKYLNKIIQGLNKILNLNPKRKYKIIEEFFTKEQQKRSD